MTKYERNILTVLKNQFAYIVGEKPFKSDSETREFYLDDYEDNLYLPMSVAAKAAYGQGTGNEIDSEKINALRSSSALTYNLFWDNIAEIDQTQDNIISNGIYQVELEKQYHTLKPSATTFPANLDAFLYCKWTKEAIACEMKLAEWLFGVPGKLRTAYLDPENYIDPEAGTVFVAVAKSLIDPGNLEKPEKKEYRSKTSR